MLDRLELSIQNCCSSAPESGPAVKLCRSAQEVRRSSSPLPKHSGRTHKRLEIERLKDRSAAVPYLCAGTDVEQSTGSTRFCKIHAKDTRGTVAMVHQALQQGNLFNTTDETSSGEQMPIIWSCVKQTLMNGRSICFVQSPALLPDKR